MSEEIRSDCRIVVKPDQGDGIEIHLESKVESLFGNAIRRQLERGCHALGLKRAVVDVHDGGALPFVLDARLEAAVRGTRKGSGAALLPEPAAGYDRPSSRDRFRRSRLYLPGSTPKYMVNAALHRPDAVILDLEDSVAPGQKAAARVLVRNALRVLDWGDAERMVRINPVPAGLEDLPFVVGHGAQAILVPKAESPEEIVSVAEEAARLARGAPAPWLIPVLESAEGIQRAETIARAHASVVAVTIGLEDFTADLGAARTSEGRESLWARSMVVCAARAAGVQPLDSVHSDVTDMEGLARAAREARALGFEGKGCIHPRQITVVHEALAPSAEELEQARRIVRAFEEAEARGEAVVSLGSKMIDAPVVRRARRVVALGEGASGGGA